MTSNFELAEVWKRRETSKQVATGIHADITRVEARDRPKDAFGLPGKDYLATVRWSSDDHTRHVVQYQLWLAVDGHGCRPDTVFGTPPPVKDAEQHFGLSAPLGPDGRADFQAPMNQVDVPPDAIEKTYSLPWTMDNKESLRCATIDNPHALQFRILAVDSTQVASMFDPLPTVQPSR